MKLKWFVVATLAGLLAVSGCKKDNKSAPEAGSGAAGSGMAGSGMAGGGMAGGNMAGHDMSGSNMAGGNMAGGDMAGHDMSGGNMAGAGAGATLSDADIEGMLTEMLAMMTDLGKAVDGKDCAGAAAGVNAALDTHKPFIDKMAALADDKALEARAEKIMEAGGWEKKLDEAAASLGPVAEKCESDEAFKAAMERLDKAMK